MGGIFSAPQPTSQPISQPEGTTKKIVYNINDTVSFLENGKKVTGMVTGVTCSFYIDDKGTIYGNLCDLTKSSIDVKDNKNNSHKVFINEPTLKIENMTVEEAKEKYKSGTKVSFLHKGNIVTGTIRGFGITVDADRISQEDFVIIDVPGVKYSVNVSFTDPNLKLAESVSGKQKYTLEDDNKYRIKYMKYKAKYLAQK
jgi:hypothetical protein